MSRFDWTPRRRARATPSKGDGPGQQGRRRILATLGLAVVAGGLCGYVAYLLWGTVQLGLDRPHWSTRLPREGGPS